MPESSAFRGWYPPGAGPAVAAYLGGLSREYGVPWTDARAWLADEHFVDGHHLLAGGAAAFSERFGREMLATDSVAAGVPPVGPQAGPLRPRAGR